MLGIAIGAPARNASAPLPGIARRTLMYATSVARIVPIVADATAKISVFFKAGIVALRSRKTKVTCASVTFDGVGRAGGSLTNAASSSAPYGRTIELTRTSAQNARAAHFH